MGGVFSRCVRKYPPKITIYHGNSQRLSAFFVQISKKSVMIMEDEVIRRKYFTDRQGVVLRVKSFVQTVAVLNPFLMAPTTGPLICRQRGSGRILCD